MRGLVERGLLQWNQLTHRLAAVPVMVLMPHSRCNCRCVMCDIWKANKDKRELTLEELQPHLDMFRKLRVRWVVFSGGEALLYGSLWPLCEQLEAMGIKRTLLSTGLLLERDAELCARHLDEITVSLDGPPEIHDAIRRVPRAFDKLAAGVAAVKAASPTMRITARSVVQKQNWQHLDATVQTALDLGLDELSFLPADVSSEAFNRAEPWNEARGSEVALGAEEARQLAADIETLIKTREPELRRRFLAEDADKLRRLGQYWLAVTGQGDLPPVRCNAPWVSAVVESDGAVRPCFFLPAYGNLHDENLASILSKDEAVAFRRDLDVAENETCRRCVCSLYL